MPRSYNKFSEAHKIKCRAIWYKHGSRSARETLAMGVIPLDEIGEMVGEGTLAHWIHDEWPQWKDAKDADLDVALGDKIIKSRVEEIERQLFRNIEISDKAFSEIMGKPFDSSAAANQAFFKANYEVRGLMQVQKVIEDLARMETPEIKSKMNELAKRASETTIEGEVAEEKENEENTV